MKRVSVRISDLTYDRLKAQAKADQMTMADLMTYILGDYRPASDEPENEDD